MLKARAAQSWCENASGLNPPIEQSKEFEYLILNESIFRQHSGLSFSALVPFCVDLRNRLIVGYKGKLF
jgi:hypothetical protein